MAQEVINVGSSPNDGAGDPVRTAFIKTNTNFSQLFATAGVTGITNGTSNVNIPLPNGNVLISSAGAANVLVVTGTGGNITGTLGVSGLATAGNLSVTGTIISTGTIQSIAEVTATTVTASGNLVGGNVNINNLITGSTMSLSGNIVSALGVTGNLRSANISTPGLITATGNITGGNVIGGFLYGDGGFISNVTAVSNLAVTQIANASTSVAIVNAGGNVVTTVGGTANIMVATTGGIFVTGQASATGNVSGANINATDDISGVNGFFSGNVSITGNLNAIIGLVVANSAVFNGNLVTGNNAATAGVPGYTTLGSNVIMQFAGNANSYSQINFQNINANTYASTDFIATADNGNDSTNYVNLGINSSTYDSLDYPAYGINDGYLLTNGGNLLLNPATAGKIIKFIVGGSETANVVGTLSNVGLSLTGTATAAGTIHGGNVITGGYMSAGGTISATGTIEGGNVTTPGALLSTGNVKSGNVNSEGIVSAVGNIIAGNYFLGNGSLLTGINIGAASNIANGTSNVFVVSSGGNVTIGIGGTGNVLVAATTGVAVTGILSASGNVTGGNLLTSGLISATGNITGGNILGGANVNATTHTGVTVSVSGSITGGNVITGGYISAAGTVSATGNIEGGNISTPGLIIATGNISGGNLVTAGSVTVNSGGAATAIVNGGSNAVGNIGSVSTYFNQLFAQATTALYADLAEVYSADATYPTGTVVSFGGDQEVTVTVVDNDNRVAGVISEKPSYLMNNGLEAQHRAVVALTGRVPTLVVGPVRKGDMMVSAGNGRAQACATPKMGTVIGKALENFDQAVGIIEIVVGRV